MRRLNAVEQRALRAEYVRRSRLKSEFDKTYRPTRRELDAAKTLRKQWFPKQGAFFRSKARRRVAFCTRRAGKTFGVALWFLDHLLRHPGALTLYIAQTAGAARIYMWKELRKIVLQYNLPFKFNETHLHMIHKRGGGMLILKGADKADEIEKLRGFKLAKICLDEAQSFGSHINTLINEVLGPSLRDEEGPLITTGTAGKAPSGFFYDICHGKKKRKSDGQPVYEVHKWSLQDNPYLSDLARSEEAIIDDEGYSGTDDPRFQREYRGNWVIGDQERMFAFDEARNTYEGDPPGGVAYSYGIGCDFGWHDETAMVTGAWSRASACLYVPESWSRKHQYTDDVAAKMMELSHRFGTKIFVGDTGGYGKSVCVHLQRDYGIHVAMAQKREKWDHIAFFNSALMRGEVKIRKGDPLIKQLQEVAWNENRTDAANHSRDDLCFALLYIWRHAKNMGLGRVAYSPQENVDPVRAQGIREKMEALNARPDPKPAKWYLREAGSVRSSSRYSSPAWRFLLGHR